MYIFFNVYDFICIDLRLSVSARVKGISCSKVYMLAAFTLLLLREAVLCRILILLSALLLYLLLDIILLEVVVVEV